MWPLILWAGVTLSLPMHLSWRLCFSNLYDFHDRIIYLGVAHGVMVAIVEN